MVKMGSDPINLLQLFYDVNRLFLGLKVPHKLQVSIDRLDAVNAAYYEFTKRHLLEQFCLPIQRNLRIVCGSFVSTAQLLSGKSKGHDVR